MFSSVFSFTIACNLLIHLTIYTMLQNLSNKLCNVAISIRLQFLQCCNTCNVAIFAMLQYLQCWNIIPPLPPISWLVIATFSYSVNQLILWSRGTGHIEFSIFNQLSRQSLLHKHYFLSSIFNIYK